MGQSGRPVLDRRFGAVGSRFVSTLFRWGYRLIKPGDGLGRVGGGGALQRFLRWKLGGVVLSGRYG